MHISLTNSRANGSKQWSDANRPSNDDDNPGGATPIAVTEPPAGDPEAIEEPPNQREIMRQASRSASTSAVL